MQGIEHLHQVLSTEQLLWSVWITSCWLGSGTLLVLSNRFLLTSGLTVPISLTCLHLLASCMGSNLVILSGRSPRQKLTCRRQASKVFLLAAIFGASVLAGVACLAYIPISFAEMIASTTPIFTAVLVYAFTGEQQSQAKLCSLLVVAMGTVVSSGGEPSWNTIGVALCVMATVCRALKAVVQQVLLTGPDKLDSMNLLNFMSVFAILILAPCICVTEGGGTLCSIAIDSVKQGKWQFLAVMAANCLAAFLTNLLGFMITKALGAVYIQVIGTFKGVVGALASIAVFQNLVTAQSAGGYCLAMFGVILFTYLKTRASGQPDRSLEAMHPVIMPDLEAACHTKKTHSMGNCHHVTPSSSPGSINQDTIQARTFEGEDKVHSDKYYFSAHSWCAQASAAGASMIANPDLPSEHPRDRWQ